MNENFMLTKLNKSDALSVFLTYHDCLNCVYDVGLKKEADLQKRYDRYDELEKGVLSVQEYLTKAETYIDTIHEYSHTPEKFIDISLFPKQISYQNLEPLTDKFSNFLEDLNKSYDNFFKFFVGKLFIYIDTQKNYKSYLEYKPKGKETPEQIKAKKDIFFTLLKNINKDLFDADFSELTNLYFDINKKRNDINHQGTIKSDIIKGHYAVSVDSNRKVTVKTFPIIEFHDQKVPLDQYAEYAFNKFFYSMQHLYAACVNTILQSKINTPGLEVCPQLIPIELFDDITKINLNQNGKIRSDKQAYVFGIIGTDNTFVNYSCSRPQDPKFIATLNRKSA